jgi:hypothetical protein
MIKSIWPHRRENNPMGETRHQREIRRRSREFAQWRAFANLRQAAKRHRRYVKIEAPTTPRAPESLSAARRKNRADIRYRPMACS